VLLLLFENVKFESAGKLVRYQIIECLEDRGKYGDLSRLSLSSCLSAMTSVIIDLEKHLRTPLVVVSSKEV